MEIENTFSTSVPGKNLKIKDYRLVFLFLKNKKWKPPPGHFQFLIFDFQNIENCFPISCFLETKIDDWDCKFVIFNSWGIKHWKSRLWIFDFQFSIWNKNQMDENHTDQPRGGVRGLQMTGASNPFFKSRATTTNEIQICFSNNKPYKNEIQIRFSKWCENEKRKTKFKCVFES